MTRMTYAPIRAWNLANFASIRAVTMNGIHSDMPTRKPMPDQMSSIDAT